MQVSRGALRVLQVIIGALIVVGVLAAGWWLLSLDTDTTETQTKASLTRLGVSGHVYYNRLNSYDGVCADIGVPANYHCHESSEAYAIEAPLPDGKYLCLDSTGFLGHTLISKGNSTACRRY